MAQSFVHQFDKAASKRRQSKKRSTGTAKFCVRLTNLPPRMSLLSLEKLLTTKKLQSYNIVHMGSDQSTLKTALIEVETYRDFKKVLGLHSFLYQGYQIHADRRDVAVEERHVEQKVEPSENREYQRDCSSSLEVFVKRLNYDTTEDDLERVFGQFGPVENITLPRWYDSGKPRGFAFVRFGSKRAQQKAIEKDGQIILHGSELSIRPNYGRAAKYPSSTHAANSNKRLKEKPEGCTTLYVGNINFNVTEEQLHEYFSRCGTIENVRIVRQEYTNRSRGFGYIEFSKERSVTRALAKNGVEFCDRPLRVDYAEPYDPSRNKKKSFQQIDNDQVDTSEIPHQVSQAPPQPQSPIAIPVNSNSSSPTGQQSPPCLPSAQGFIVNHFINKPVAGMAALAGSMCQGPQPNMVNPYMPYPMQFAPTPGQQFLPQFMPHLSQPMAPPMPGTCSPPLASSPPVQHMVPPFQNMFQPTATQTIYNYNTPHESGGDKIQIEATFFTQGVPGLGQVIAPYAMVSQRKLADLANAGAVMTPTSKIASGPVGSNVPLNQMHGVQSVQLAMPSNAPPQVAATPSNPNVAQPVNQLYASMRKSFSADEEQALQQSRQRSVLSSFSNSCLLNQMPSMSPSSNELSRSSSIFSISEDDESIWEWRDESDEDSYLETTTSF